MLRFVLLLTLAILGSTQNNFQERAIYLSETDCACKGRYAEEDDINLIFDIDG